MQTAFAFRGWGKTGPAHSFPTLTRVSINLVQKLGYLCGENLGWSVTFPPWQVIASTLPWHEYTYNLCFLGGGEKTGPAHSFPTLTSDSINLVQKLGYLGGEKLGQPILSPPWLVKVLTLPCHEYANNLCFLGGGEKLGRPILSPPWLLIPDKIKHQPCADGFCPPRLVKTSTILCHEYANNLCFLGGGGKTGPAHSFPNPTR